MKKLRKFSSIVLRFLSTLKKHEQFDVIRSNRPTFLSITSMLWIILLHGVVSAQSVPVTEIFDGTIVEGNQYFFFLPPVVSNPLFSGVLDESLEPIVEICELENGLCQFPAIAQFQFEGEDGVNLKGNHYQLNWNPTDYNLDPDGFYQVRVLVDGLLMGFVIVSGDLGTETIPIKFRLEEGCADWGAVGPEGGILEFATGVTLDIPINAISSYVVIRILPLPTNDLQALLDERPYRSSDKNVLSGFIGEPDGMTFNLPITVIMQIPQTSKLPIQVKMSLDPLEYWITPTELIYDPATNIVEFTIIDFSGHSTVEVVGAEIELPDNCSSGRILVVVQSSDFSSGNGCQIVGESVEVTFLDCEGQPTQSVHISETTPECGDNFSLTVDVIPTTVEVCREQQVHALLKDQNDNVWEVPLYWSSESPQNAPIHPVSGVTTGMEEGIATVKAKTPDIRWYGEGLVFVVPPPSIIVTPSTVVTLDVGDQDVLSAIDESGAPFYCIQRSQDGLSTSNESVTWTSLNPNIATVDQQSGHVQAIQAGQVEIQASSCSAQGSAIINVMEPELPCNIDEAIIWVDPYNVGMLQGESAQLTATVVKYDPITHDFVPMDCIETNFYWYSEKNSIATVSQSGLVTGISVGHANIFVELVDYPEVYKGGAGADIWYTLCDKDGDGKLDFDMVWHEEMQACCGPQPPLPCCPHDCPCGPCDVSYYYTQACITGEIRGDCYPSDYVPLWEDMEVSSLKNSTLLSNNNNKFDTILIMTVDPNTWLYMDVFDFNGLVTDYSYTINDSLTILTCKSPESDSVDIIILGPKTNYNESESELNDPISIFPNPTNDHLTIVTKDVGIFNIEITSMDGRLMLKNEFTDPTYRLDLSFFEKGMYFLTIKTNRSVKTEKIIKL